MFNRIATASGIARQIAGLLNENNKLNTKYSEKDILSKSKSYIVETTGEKVIGCVELDRQGYNMSEIKHLCVSPAFRGLGVSEALIIAAINSSRTPTVYATVREDNVPSQRAFLACGFTKAESYTTGTRDVMVYIRVCPQWIRSETKKKEIEHT